MQSKMTDYHVLRTEDQQLSCPNHEEADTKIIYHIAQIDFDAHITIRCSDTDIAVIMLGNMQHVHKNLNISMHVGVGNSQRYINITKLYENLGESLSAALPAFHAFTGCDFNSAFFRKGKVRPFGILTKNTQFIKAFEEMATVSASDFQTLFPTVQQFLCRLYGFKNINDIDEARTACFLKMYNIVEREEVLKIPEKNFDGSALPPCKAELEQHFLRTYYITNLWSNAHKKVPTDLHPLNYGWEHVDDKYSFKWFSGDQLPSIDDMTQQETSDDREVEEDEHLDSSDEETDIYGSDSDSED